MTNALESIKQILRNNGYYRVTETANELCALKDNNGTTSLVVGLTIVGSRASYAYPSKEDAIVAISSWNGEGDPDGFTMKELS